MIEKILTKEILAPIIIVSVSYLLYVLLKTIIKKSFKFKVRGMDDKRKKTIMSLFLNTIKIFIIVLASLMILDIYGIDAKSLLASLGVFAAVTALAMQDILKDFIAGISIVLEGQFRIGDTISIDSFKGEVIYLSLKSTKIKSYTGEIKIYANHNVQNVINYSLTDSLAVIDISVSYDYDLEKVEKILSNLCEKLSKELPNLKGNLELLGVQELADSAVIYRITCLTESMKQFEVQRKVLREIKIVLDKNKMEVPFPQMVIHNG